MGYRKQATLYKLKFEKYDGLEVFVKSLSVGALLEMTEIASSLDKIEDPQEQKDSTQKLLQKFSSCLVKWNLEDEDGTSVPATYEGVSNQEFDFVLELIMSWMNTVASVSPNLEKTSDAGLNLGQLPMETLESPPS